MRPYSSTWDEERQGEINRKLEAHKEQKLKSFVSVMSNVVNFNKKVKIDTRTNGVIFYRHLKHKRKAVMEEHQSGKKKIRPFETSTPLHYREQTVDTDVSSDNLSKDSLEDGTHTDGGDAGQGKTNLSFGTDRMVIDCDKPGETLTQAMACHAVTIDSYHDAETSYVNRLSKHMLVEEVFQNWNSTDKFKANLSDTHSFEVMDLLGVDDDLGLEKLFSMDQVEDSDNLTDNSGEVNYDLVWLFGNEQEQLLGAGDIDYDMAWLFGNEQEYLFGVEDINLPQLEQIIRVKKENKLYSIFLKSPLSVPASSCKRKLSPQEENTIKMRRMTIASDSSPSLRTPRRRITAPKSHGARSLSRRGEAKRDRNVGLKQVKLTTLWREDNDHQDQEGRT